MWLTWLVKNLSNIFRAVIEGRTLMLSVNRSQCEPSLRLHKFVQRTIKTTIMLIFFCRVHITNKTKQLSSDSGGCFAFHIFVWTHISCCCCCSIGGTLNLWCRGLCCCQTWWCIHYFIYSYTLRIGLQANDIVYYRIFNICGSTNTLGYTLVNICQNFLPTGYGLPFPPHLPECGTCFTM